MRYTADIVKFRDLLLNRPALIKCVTNLTVEQVLSFMFWIDTWEDDEGTPQSRPHSNLEIYTYLPDIIKEDKDLALKYVENNRWGGQRNLSKGLLESLNPEERLKLISISNKGSAIDVLPNPTKDEWTHAIFNHSYDENICNVPEQFLDEDLLIQLVRNGGKDIPESVWKRPDAQQLLIKFTAADCDRFNDRDVPTSILTKEALETYIDQADKALNRDDIPPELWDEKLALKAVKSSGRNLHYIPQNLITEEMCIIAAVDEVLLEGSARFRTRPVLVAYISHFRLGHFGWIKPMGKLIPKSLKNDPSFQIDVAKEGGSTGIQALLSLEDVVITPETWLEILKISPECLKSLKKLDQTDDLIDAFLSQADPELIDKVAKYINLTKIRKEHAPLLIGCKSSIILSTIQKHLKNVSSVSGKDIVEIEMAPGEYAKIRGYLND